MEFPNGMSCSIYVSRSLYQFQVHGRAPPRTGVYDQMEQLFTNRKFHFCYHRNFRDFFLNGKRPCNLVDVPIPSDQTARRLSKDSGFDILADQKARGLKHDSKILPRLCTVTASGKLPEAVWRFLEGFDRQFFVRVRFLHGNDVPHICS